MPCLEQNKGDDDMNWKKIMLYNDEKLRKKNGLLKDKIEETINQLNVLVMTHDLMLRGDLPRVNVYLNLDGSDSIRVANGFQETLYGDGGYYAFDVAVNPSLYTVYGNNAPEIIANKAMSKYLHLIGA
jgi:hypothetical protein